ncbi:DUF3592 domain-containing protein [Phreatobacter sp. HK31-P]
MEGSVVIALFLGFIALVVALLAYLSWQTIVMRRIMRGWVRVPAKALRARTAPLGSKTANVTLEVEVDYDFAGRSYRRWCGVPDRTGYNVAAMNPTAALADLIARHSGGRSIEIIVNPADPGIAFLRMPSLKMLVMMIVAAILLPAAIFIPMFAAHD